MTEENKIWAELNEKAADRKKHLLAMASMIYEKKDNETVSDQAFPKPIFRSYLPLDKDLRQLMIPAVKPADTNEMLSDRLSNRNSKSSQEVEESEINAATALQPKMIDWDLKRDSMKKMKKLERRTQNAIAQLVRQRLKETKQLDTLEEVPRMV
ncbi:hypothetical protein GJ496_000995 [Pomphorhynchus laevis]|nr:hypothetical protein GJ496_000995 [Pomphorhynchus laevis]